MWHSGDTHNIPVHPITHVFVSLLQPVAHEGGRISRSFGWCAVGLVVGSLKTSRREVLVPSVQQCVWLGTCMKISQQRSFNWKGHCHFRFHKSMTKEARRGERKLSCGSKHQHQVSSEHGHSFMSPESPTNWAASPTLALLVSILASGRQIGSGEASPREPIQ